jgi:hypothetical protein
MLNSLLTLGPREGEEGFMRLRFIAGPPLHNHILIVSRIKEEYSESSAKDPKFLVLFEDAEHLRGVHDREVGIISAFGYTNFFKKFNGAAREGRFQPRLRILEHLNLINKNLRFDVSWPEGIKSINEIGTLDERRNIKFTTHLISSQLEISYGDDGEICIKKTGNPTTSSLHGP